MFQVVDEPSLSHKDMMDDIKRILKNLGEVESMQIFMKTKTGETITLDVKSSDTTDRLKAMILDKRSGISYAGSRLAGGVLSDYNIPERVHIVRSWFT